MPIFSKSDLRAARAVFLMEIEFAGLVFRFSSYPIELLKDDNTPIPYDGSIEDFNLVESTELLGVDIEANSLSTSCIFHEVDMMEMWRKGFVLEGSKGELSYVLSKNGIIQQSYEEREIVLSGIVQQPQFGDPLEPKGFCSLSIERAPDETEDGGLILDPYMVINDQTFPKHDPDTAGGKTYPLVFANSYSPPITSSGLNRTLHNTPAYCIQRHTVSDHTLFLIAGHKVKSTSVKILGPRDQAGYVTVETGIDGRGNVYSYVDVDAADVYQPGRTYLSGEIPSNPQWWISWDNALPSIPTAKGGIPSPYTNDAPLVGGGDICLFILQKCGYDIDTDAWGSLRVQLNEFIFEGYINDPATAGFEFLQEHILPWLPIEVKNGPHGIKPEIAQIYNVDLYPRPVEEITTGADFQLISAITTETNTNDIINDISLEFAQDGPADDTVLRARIGYNLESTGLQGADDEYSLLSQQRYGRKAEILGAPFIKDRYTAIRALKNILRSRALPLRSMEFFASIEYGTLRIGDIISLTSSELFFSSTIAVIVSKEYYANGWRLKVAIEDNPVTTKRHF